MTAARALRVQRLSGVNTMLTPVFGQFRPNKAKSVKTVVKTLLKHQFWPASNPLNYPLKTLVFVFFFFLSGIVKAH